MNENQIERKLEQLFNSLDGCLLAGKITQAQYDSNAKAISEWAEHQSRRIPMPADKPYRSATEWRF